MPSIDTEKIGAAVKKYYRETCDSYDQLKLIQNKTIDILNQISSYYHCNDDSYIGEDLHKIRKLQKLIVRYKTEIEDIRSTMYRSLKGNGDMSSNQFKKYSQSLYYLNTISFVANDDNSLQTDINVEADGYITGSIKVVFGKRCYVFGTEDDEIRDFTGKQGNNSFGMANDCGIASVAQLLILSGKTVSENDVVRVAIGSGLCNITQRAMQFNGATSAMHRYELLKKYDITSYVVFATISEVQRYIEKGHGVIVSVDAGILWSRQSDVGTGHALLLYGTVHEESSGALIGLIACDTGSGNMCLPISVLDFSRMYYSDRGINVTREKIR